MKLKRTHMRTKFSIFVVIASLSAIIQSASGVERALPAGTLPNDSRLGPLKELDGYFPFSPPASKTDWDKRAESVRRQILVSQGLWPMPKKTPLNAVIHGKIDLPEYSIEKVYFESAPGFFVTGNLYRPKNSKGRVPGVLFAHGHWKDARLSLEDHSVLLQKIANGEERFESGGRSMFQSMCVQLARMGCVVWQWDMLSDSDSVQFPSEVIHKFDLKRPEMNTLKNWGLYSAQAEAHLQSVMGLQSWNSIRSLDFLLSLPEVDENRIAMTGASGGGTQTMILAAIDERVKLSFPAVMVSTAMQGGCTCENASLLRVNTGNVEFAALVAPRSQGMTTADDWTKEMSEKGFPELKQLYELVGASDNVMLNRGEHFQHNYNAVSRSAFYTWLNQRFKLGFEAPVIEHDYEPLSREQLSVWDQDHPAPKSCDAGFERKLLRWFTDDAEEQLRSLATQPDEFREKVAAAVEVLIGRNLNSAGDVELQHIVERDRGEYVEKVGVLRNKTYGEELPVVWLCPKQWNGRSILWLDDSGKAALFNSDDSLNTDVLQCVRSGVMILGADLLYQGEFLKDGKPRKQARAVLNRTAVPAFTLGYNAALFAQRTHDVLSLVSFLRVDITSDIPHQTSIRVAGFGVTGPLVAAARALVGDAIDRAVVDTNGFRFADLLDWRDPQFMPGAAKYLDVPGLLLLGAPCPLWLADSGCDISIVSAAYSKANQSKSLTVFRGDASEEKDVAVKWLLE